MKSTKLTNTIRKLMLFMLTIVTALSIIPTKAFAATYKYHWTEYNLKAVTKEKWNKRNVNTTTTYSTTEGYNKWGVTYYNYGTDSSWYLLSREFGPPTLTNGRWDLESNPPSGLTVDRNHVIANSRTGRAYTVSSVDYSYNSFTYIRWWDIVANTTKSIGSIAETLILDKPSGLTQGYSGNYYYEYVGDVTEYVIDYDSPTGNIVGSNNLSDYPYPDDGIKDGKGYQYLPDEEGPTFELAIDKTPNEYGWFSEDVTVSIVNQEDISGFDSLPYAWAPNEWTDKATKVFPVAGETLPENGEYTVNAWMKDSHGNVSNPLTGEIKFKIDKVKPSAAAQVSDDDKWTRSKTITISASDTGGSGLLSYSLNGNDGPWKPWTNSASSMVDTITSTPQAPLSIAVKDKAGNTSDTLSVTVNKIDDKPPSIIGITESGWSNDSVTITVMADDLQTDGTAGSGIRGYQFGSDAEQVENTWTFTGDEDATLTIKVYDNTGRVTETPYTITHIDKTKPSITSITKTIGDVYVGIDSVDWAKNGQEVVVTIAASDEKSGVSEYTIDGSLWNTWPKTDGVHPDSSITLTYTANTKDTLKINVRDLVGNTALEIPQEVPVRVDVTSPNITDRSLTTESSHPWITVDGKQWTGGKVTLSISASDAGDSGLAAEAYRFTGAYVESGSGVWQEAKSTVITNNGVVTIEVRDVAGNIYQTTEEIDCIDITAPNITDITGNRDNWDSADITLTIIANDPTSYNGKCSGIPETGGYYFDSCQDDIWRDSPSFTYTVNGTYFLTVRDAVGNTHTKVEKIIDRIDKIKPVVTNVTQNPDASVWTGGPNLSENPVTITAEASDEGGSTIKQYGFEVVGSSEGTKWQTENTFKVYQNCSVRVWTKDNAGNISETPYPIDITNIDRTAPAKPIITGNAETWTNQDVTLHFQKPTDYAIDSTTEQSGVKWYRWSNSEAWIAWPDEDVVSKAFTGNQDVTAQVKDGVGNVTSADTVHITYIDKNAPQIQWQGQQSWDVWTKGPVTLNAVMKDLTMTGSGISGIKEYSWTGTPNGYTITIDETGHSSEQTSISVQDSSTITLSVTDHAGNTAEKSITINNIDGTAPNLSVMLTAASADRKGVITQLYATDSASGLAPQTFCWNYDPDNPGAAEWTNEAQRVLQSGKTFCIAARDNVGNVSYQTVKPKAYEMPNSGGNVPMFSQSTMACSGYILGKTAYMDENSVVHRYESEPLTVTVHAEPQYGGWMAGYAMLGSVKYPITWDTVGSPELTQEAAAGTFTITPETFTATKKNVDLTVHLFEYEDETKATRINQDTLTTTVSIDVTAPITSISLYADTITITARDTLAGMESVQYRMQGTEAWTDYTAPFELPESGILEVKAVDKVSNESITASVYLTKTGGTSGGSSSPLDEGTASAEYRTYWFNYYIIGSTENNRWRS